MDNVWYNGQEVAPETCWCGHLVGDHTYAGQGSWDCGERGCECAQYAPQWPLVP